MTLLFTCDTVVSTSWRYTLEEHVPSQRHMNEVIVAYVAGGGCMHLYTYHDRLGENFFIVTGIALYLFRKTAIGKYDRIRGWSRRYAIRIGGEQVHFGFLLAAVKSTVLINYVIM